MFSARKLQLGKLLDREGLLDFDFWLEGTRQFGLGHDWRMRVAPFGRIPSDVGVDLSLAQAGQVVVDGILGIEAEVLGVGADESFVEDSAGKQFEVFLFDGLQHAGADLGDVGNVVERELFLLARFAKFVAELAHVVKTLRVCWQHHRTTEKSALRDGRTGAG